MFKFIHAADIHLDSPLLNLQHYDGAPADSLRVATRDAFDNLVQHAIDEQVRFLLIAGDLYDKDSPNFNTPIHVRGKMRDLESHGIDVFVIQGNHDATTEAKRAFSLSMPANVHVFSTRRPETKLLDDVEVAIHGQGFAKRSVEDDLSARYPAAVSGYYNIGLLHTNFGANASHDNYAPSTREGLSSKQYHYWALGHIHKRNTSIGPNPHIIYPGNTQGRHIRESGPKGCVLVHVDDTLRASVNFRSTDVWRWCHCEVDVTGCQDPEEMIDVSIQAIEAELAQAEDRALAVRIRFMGTTPAHTTWINREQVWDERTRIAVLDQFEDRVWVEKIQSQTRPALQGSEEPLPEAAWGELVAGIHHVHPSADTIEDVREDIQKVLASLPQDERLAHEAVDLASETCVAELIADAKQMLVAKLLGSGDEA